MTAKLTAPDEKPRACAPLLKFVPVAVEELDPEDDVPVVAPVDEADTVVPKWEEDPVVLTVKLWKI